MPDVQYDDDHVNAVLTTPHAPVPVEADLPDQPDTLPGAPQRVSRPAPAASGRRTARSRPVTLYELVGRSCALVMVLAMAAAIWVVGAYFTLRLLTRVAAHERIAEVLLLFGVTPDADTLLWLVRGIPVGITLIEVFLLPRWNWWWTPSERRIAPSGRLHWLSFLVVLTIDVWTTFEGLRAWVIAQVGLNLAVMWSTIGALGLGIVIALVPEKLGRWAMIELVTLWRPIGSALWRRCVNRPRYAHG